MPATARRAGAACTALALGAAGLLLVSACGSGGNPGTAAVAAKPSLLGDFGPGAPSFSVSPDQAVTSSAIVPSLPATVPPLPPFTGKPIVLPAGTVIGPPRVTTKGGSDLGKRSGPGTPGQGTSGAQSTFLASPSPVAVAPGDSVEANRLTVADVGNGAQAVNGPGDQEIDGETSLSLCSGSFPSEANRVARHFTTFSTAAGATIATNEIVRYSTGTAAQAFSQVGAAEKTCPTSGAGAASTVDAPANLGANALIVVLQLTASGPQLYSATAYQQNGDLLAITSAYGQDHDATVATVERLGAIQATRL